MSSPFIQKMSNLFSKKRRRSSSSSTRSFDQYQKSLILQSSNSLLLMSLPVELLLKVFENLSQRDFLQLCLTCKYLNLFIYKYFLYNWVDIKSFGSLLSFKKTILKNKKTNKLPVFVNNIKFCHPIKSNSHVDKYAAFTYSSPLSSNRFTLDYIESLMELVAFLPNLQSIDIYDITPGFQFPEWTSSIKQYAHEHNYYPTLKKLSLASEAGWNIALRPNLLWPFGSIQELQLNNMIVDSQSLTKPVNLLTLCYQDENGLLINNKMFNNELDMDLVYSPISSLGLSSCSIASNSYNMLFKYFQNVQILKLSSLKSFYDILLCLNFPNLREFHLDLNSKCFSCYDSIEFNSINVNNDNSNYGYFNSVFVPKFYLNYEKFRNIIEKIQTNPKIEKILLTNVSFTNLKPVDPEDITNEDHNLVNTNLYKFLETLKNFEKIEFVMLKNYTLHQQRSKQDWGNLLEPCFNSRNTIRVKDRDMSLLFQRNMYY